MRARFPLLVIVGASAAGLIGAGTARAAPAGPPELRVNQVGYAPGETKLAVLMTAAPAGRARVAVIGASGRTVLRVRVQRDHGRWSRRYRHVYGVDISALRRPGRYRLRIRLGRGSAISPTFVVAPARVLYERLAGNALSFFGTQRDGPGVPPGPLGRVPSHLSDLSATVYRPPAYDRFGVAVPLRAVAGPQDVSGGWFDAGDYLKFVETASFVDIAIEVTALRHPTPGVIGPATAEARWGTDWLLKMFHQDTGALDGQVGIGDGRGSAVLGDHDVWRLPQADDQLRVHPGSPQFFNRYRPALRFADPGQPISPNLAGRLAAAFGLCSQLFRSTDPGYADRCLLAGQTVYDRAAVTDLHGLQTTDPFSFYPEGPWRDDMGLGASELYLATQQAAGLGGLPHTVAGFYLQPATAYAAAEMTSGEGGGDSFTLYQVAPLLDSEISLVLADDERRNPGDTDNYAVQQPSVVADLAGQLTGLARAATREPFGLADLNGRSDSVAHALGVAATADFYDELTGSRRFAGLASTERAWVLGTNAWGSSFVIGAGSRFPRCPQHQVANLSGSLTGRGRILLGGTVDGPTDASALADLGLPDGYRRCPAGRAEPFARFNGRGAAYLDSPLSSATSEPSDDVAALALLAFSQAAGGAG